jgi:hypothetical protein
MTSMSQRPVPTIRFDATLYTIDKSTVLRLPEKASKKLPSRGQVAVQGSINGHQFRTVLEPDGNFGHWMKIDRKLQKSAAERDARNRVSQGLAGAERATGSQDGSGSCPSEDPRRVERNYADGALGMGSLGQCNPEP